MAKQKFLFWNKKQLLQIITEKNNKLFHSKNFYLSSFYDLHENKTIKKQLFFQGAVTF